MPSEILQVALVSFLISTVFCPLYIAYSKKVHFQQQVREDGPKTHLSKKGTPTMGGLVFILASVVSVVWLAPMDYLLMLAMLVTLFSALLGWLDDYSKVTRSRSLGLKARTKLLGQVGLTIVLVYFLNLLGHSTEVEVPFTDLAVEMGPFYIVLVFLMISGTTNAVNLTDGIDGLAAGASIVALMAFLVLASISGEEGIAFFCAAMVGGTFGFLIYNLHPARLFMGDVGSLALGGAMAAAAVLLKVELTLVIIGGLFILETLSVMVQVFFFRLTGKRVLLMSPLHHHFELKGWSEWQVVTSLWAVAFLFAVIGLLEATEGWF